MVFTDNAPRCLLRVLGNEAKLIPEGSTPIYPHLKASDSDSAHRSYQLIIEGHTVVSDVPLAEALLWWAAAHYVLNQKVAQRGAMWFMAHHIMRVVPDKLATVSVMNDIASLE